MVAQLPVLSRESVKSKTYPERIIQFGTGNFLKGFFNSLVQQLNDRCDFDAGIVAVKLRCGNEQQLDAINQQNGLFTVNARGIKGGQSFDDFELIQCQNRAISPYQNFLQYIKLADNPDIVWVVSNSTEAGIFFDENELPDAKPAKSFPAKLTQLLFRRFLTFSADPTKGLRIFCCELIDDNAHLLRDIVLRYAKQWQLPEDFQRWVNKSCRFCNTLVDRIVTGKVSAPRRETIEQQLGYRDSEIIEAEGYYQWVIEAEADDKETLQRLFPKSADLNIIVTSDLAIYRERKIRILNGAHSACCPIACMLGIDTVYQATQDFDASEFMRRLLFEEICPTLAMCEAEVNLYAEAILERFANPFLQHEWKSIALNSISKWRARLLPVLKDHHSLQGSVPPRLLTALACLQLMYRGEFKGRQMLLNDDGELIAIFSEAWLAYPDLEKVCQRLLASVQLWGEDLSTAPVLVENLAACMRAIESDGLRDHLRRLLAKEAG